MRSKQARCPSSRDLERAYWTADLRTRLHADGCSRCGAEWQEIASLVEAGRSIAPAPAGRHEEIRTALLAGMQSPAAEPRRRSRWLLAAPMAAAVAIAIAWWAWPVGKAPLEVRRARVLGHEGAHYMIAAAQPDEMVRLVDGTLTVEVDPLRSGERFRVITGDAEIEVVGTAFDVSAAGDRLLAVRVMHGRVEVRPAGAPARTLSIGEAWQPSAAAAVTPSPAPALAPAPAPITADAGPAPARIDTGAGAPRAGRARSAGQQAFDDGWRAIRARDFDGAAAAFERAASSRDGAVAEDAAYWRAVALARAGDSDGAIRAFDAFLAGHPGSSRAGEASVMAGWLLFERGDHALAARRFRAAVDDPTPRVRASASEGLAALRRAGH